MKRLASLALALCAVAAVMLVSGCTTVQNADDAAQKVLSYACPALETAYVSLTAYQSAGGSVSDRDMATAQAAYDLGQQTCAKVKAGTATAQDALVLVVSETAVLSRIIRKH